MKNYKKEWLVDQYITQRKSASRIAKEQHAACLTILKYLRKFEIPLRSHSDAISGKNNPNWGKTHTSEIRKRMSDKARARWDSPGARTWMSLLAKKRETDKILKTVRSNKAKEQWKDPNFRESVVIRVKEWWDAHPIINRGNPI